MLNSVEKMLYDCERFIENDHEMRELYDSKTKFVKELRLNIDAGKILPESIRSLELKLSDMKKRLWIILDRKRREMRNSGAGRN
ncbi:MAG: hypothetical protein LBQ66_00755 [Planctomycetaceae bacterium]|nr:hypothetical protein [Planctomycetaceae bacterium]